MQGESIVQVILDNQPWLVEDDVLQKSSLTTVLYVDEYCGTKK